MVAVASGRNDIELVVVVVVVTWLSGVTYAGAGGAPCPAAEHDAVTPIAAMATADTKWRFMAYRFPPPMPPGPLLPPPLPGWAVGSPGAPPTDGGWKELPPRVGLLGAEPPTDGSAGPAPPPGTEVGAIVGVSEAVRVSAEVDREVLVEVMVDVGVPVRLLPHATRAVSSSAAIRMRLIRPGVPVRAGAKPGHLPCAA